MNQQTDLALVVGGSTGIGFATAKRLIKRGITTVVLGKDADRLKQAGVRWTRLVRQVEGLLSYSPAPWVRG